MINFQFKIILFLLINLINHTIIVLFSKLIYLDFYQKEYIYLARANIMYGSMNSAQ